jgi:hypothetical protein
MAGYDTTPQRYTINFGLGPASQLEKQIGEKGMETV